MENLLRLCFHVRYINVSISLMNTDKSSQNPPAHTTEDTEPILSSAEVSDKSSEAGVETAKNPSANNGYTAETSYVSNIEWEADRRALNKAKHDALNGFLAASVMQRVDLLRDTLAVSVSILFGALTIYFTSGPDHDIIKTQFLFFTAIAVLTTGVVANLIARIEIIKHLQEAAFQIERSYLDLFVASREVMKNPSQYNIDNAYRIEGNSPAFPKLNRRANYGHSLSIWSIVVSVVAIMASFSIIVRF
jgi:hypothetical protein